MPLKVIVVALLVITPVAIISADTVLHSYSACWSAYPPPCVVDCRFKSDYGSWFMCPKVPLNMSIERK